MESMNEQTVIFYLICTSSLEGESSIKSVVKTDMEMCCCKKHLHARWAITALIEIAKKQKISLEFGSYKEFFDVLTEKCTKDNLAYINWDCTPNKKSTCIDIE